MLQRSAYTPVKHEVMIACHDTRAALPKRTCMHDTPSPPHTAAYLCTHVYLGPHSPVIRPVAIGSEGRSLDRLLAPARPDVVNACAGVGRGLVGDEGEVASISQRAFKPGSQWARGGRGGVSVAGSMCMASMLKSPYAGT
jgi:hypothetical protein